MPDLEDYLIVSEFPETPAPRMVAAFRGWPDAGDAATTTVQYLLAALGAIKFAEIDPEEFFNFTQQRPRSVRDENGRRQLQWPANEFYHWPGTASAPGAIFFLGTEPNLRWRTFSRLTAAVAQRCGVTRVVHIGALRDAVPHTRPIRFTGTSTNPATQREFSASQIGRSNYQGPTGITLPFAEALTNRGISHTSLWGHVANYLQAAPNFRVCLGLAHNVAEMLALPVDLTQLQTLADAFDQEVAQVIADDDQLRSYIATLEERYDANSDPQIPDADELVRELERFLRTEQRRSSSD